MKILLNRIPAGNDLPVGLQVCYKDINGTFSRLGIITETYISFGVQLFLINTAMGAYMADELRLIAD